MLSKLTYVEDKIIISPLFLCISVIFLQKAMVQYTIFKTVLLYLLKVYLSLYVFIEYEQVTKVPFKLFSALLAENRQKSN